MNEMMSEMREMMEKRIKRIIKKLVEKMGVSVSEEEMMRMLEDTESESLSVSGRANGVVSIAAVEVKPVSVEKKTLNENGEPVKKTRAPAKKKEPELDENGEPVKKTRAPPKKKEPELDENGEPVKKTRAPPKKKEPELDENGEPVKKTRAPAKKKEPVDGEPVKKTRAPAKKRSEGVESLVSMVPVPVQVPVQVVEVVEVVQEKKEAAKSKRAKGVESLISMMVEVKLDDEEYDSDAETIKMPESGSESESEGNMLYDSKIKVMRVVIKGIAYLYDENLNAYHEDSKTFVGKYEPELGQISLLDMDSGSEEDGSEDECPALSD